MILDTRQTTCKKTNFRTLPHIIPSTEGRVIKNKMSLYACVKDQTLNIDLRFEGSMNSNIYVVSHHFLVKQRIFFPFQKQKSYI